MPGTERVRDRGRGDPDLIITFNQNMYTRRCRPHLLFFRGRESQDDEVLPDDNGHQHHIKLEETGSATEMQMRKEAG